MVHELPPLAYDYNALEPHVDEQTMRIHHDKHHAAYIANLNKALESAADLASKSIDDVLSNIGSVPDDIRDALIASCQELGTFVDKETIDRICPAIGQAIDANDPGLIDVIVEELAALHGD